MNKKEFTLFGMWFSSTFPFVSIQVIDWIFCQAYLETGNFQSKIFQDNLNYFGMKKANKRLTVAVGSSRGHALYDALLWSIVDYMYWCQFNGFVQSDFKDLDVFLAKFKKTSYNPKMDSYINSINQLYSKFFVK